MDQLTTNKREDQILTYDFDEKSLQNDTIIVYDYIKVNTSSVRTPEQELMLAVLEQAFQDYIVFGQKRPNKDFEDVKNWFFEDNGNNIGSFDFICNIFNYNKNYLRKLLKGLNI